MGQHPQTTQNKRGASWRNHIPLRMRHVHLLRILQNWRPFQGPSELGMKTIMAGRPDSRHADSVKSAEQKSWLRKTWIFWMLTVLLLLLSSKYQDHECNQYWMAKSPSHPMRPTRIGSTSYYYLPYYLPHLHTQSQSGPVALQCSWTTAWGHPVGVAELVRRWESNLGPLNSWRYPVKRSIVFDFDGEI